MTNNSGNGCQQVKDYTIKHIDSSLIMLNDVNSFIFLRSKNGLSLLKQHNLGGGNLLSVLGQFTILNFLAKVHYLLEKGKGIYITPEKRERILKIKREANAKFKKYIFVPRLGDVNETEAFVSLVLNYPADLGIPKKKETIEKVWKDIRNKISHIATLEADNRAIPFEYINLEYPESRDRPKNKNWILKAFVINSPGKRKKWRDEIKQEDPELKNPMSKVMWNLHNNLVNIDLLNLSIKEIAGWIIGKINNDRYAKNHLFETKDWLKLQFQIEN